jgi:cysteine desulfurase
MSQTTLYLDYAAATPMDERVIKATLPYLTDNFFNPSSPYAPAIQVRRDYERAKEVIAKCIGVSADELVMTAGATESINLAINSFSGHKVCPAVEHDSVLNAVKKGDHTIVSVSHTGRIKLDELKKAITNKTEIVSVALANHELGTMQPISDVAKIIHDERQARLEAGDTTPIYLHCDASQGFGLADIKPSRLGVDMLTLNAAKIYGPKQVGLLWVSPGVAVKPAVVGGGQERGLRSGTENVAGVIGFAEATLLADKRRKGEVKRLGELRGRLQKRFEAELPECVISGEKRHRLANFLHVSFPNIDAERLVFMLEVVGIYVATGSACAANKATRSHVLDAIGLASEVADGSLRITLGRHTTEADIETAAQKIVEVVKKEAARTGVSV